MTVGRSNANLTPMKTDALLFRFLAGIVPLFLAAGAIASPLTWFPGPAHDPPVSAAATCVLPDKSNLLIGGDDQYYFQTYPQSLGGTNLYWTYYPALPSSTTIAAGAVSTGGLIVFYGGTDGTASTSAAIGYSTSGDALQTFANMSVPRSYFGYAPDSSGNAYAIGGLDDTGQPLASAERFNMDANSWTSIAALPQPRYDFPAVFDHTNLIYIFGGSTNVGPGNETASVLRYSTKSHTWTNLAPMPVPASGSAAALAVDGKIYVAGGVSGGVTIDTVQVYNPASNTWTISTSLPEPLSEAAMGADSLGRVVVMDGIDANGNDVGDVWRSQLLGSPDTIPVFTQYPAANATYLQAYSSSIAATGNPQPTYLLVSGPSTMQVDPNSGAITWTPGASDIGADSVTIRATNYAGFADYTFSINVPNPPPAALSNLTVVSVTDNSVTISWSPEPTVVGPCTFRAYLKHVSHSPRGSGATVTYSQTGPTVSQPTMTITGLAPGSTTSFYLTATGPSGISGYAAISATTTAPHGPAALTLTGVSSTSVGLSWAPSPGPAQNPLYSPIVSYTIMERKTSPVVDIPTVTNITGTSGTVTGLKPGGSHIWWVSGVDAAGNYSPLSFLYYTVTNPVPAAVRPAPIAAGAFRFNASLGGPLPSPVPVQATTNPLDPNSWTTIGWLPANSTSAAFTDTNASQYPMRFYRVMTP